MPRGLQRWLTVGAMLALPVLAYAQEAALSGTVTDTTGGALPGVTVRAVHEASGNSFEAVTNERGEYRLAVRVGSYRLTAELAGFAPVTRTLTLLVGQDAVVDLQMGVSGLQESVTVTGEAPLLDVTESSLGGNIDPRQMQELPILGRDWMALTLLTPGARANQASDVPFNFGESATQGDFQVNVDGQQITMLMSWGSTDGQPRYSRDAIAEFEVVSSRFDATQSRSSGVQVNAITKSGTNTPSGSFAGYFRDDSMNAADFIAKRVLPYQNQQLSGTLGGPIRKDRVHVFGSYEYEREPGTLLYTTPYPHFNRELHSLLTEKKSLVRLDAQFSAQTRLAVRGTLHRLGTPLRGSGSATSTPSSATGNSWDTNQILATVTQVLGTQAVNEVKVGYAGFATISTNPVKNPDTFGGFNAMTIELQGLDVGGTRSAAPEDQFQDVFSVRDDFTYSFTKGGRHTVKLGAEYLHQSTIDFRCDLCRGNLDASGGPIPSNIESLFPDVFDATTWNLAPLSPISVRWRQLIGPLRAHIPRYATGAWVQDDWTLSPRLTLNLGLRYDLELNAFVNDVEILPFLPGNRPEDANNFGPRLGLSFSANDRTVVRGGFGLYYGTVPTAYFMKHYSQRIGIAVENDGRPDFASNPWNGPTPTFESLLARACTPALEPGCIRREAPYFGRMYGENYTMPHSYQSSIGLQRQLGDTMAVEADYVYVGLRNNPQNLFNINLTYDPATGANYPFSDISRRVWPYWGAVSLGAPGHRHNLHSLQTAFTKRMSQGWQASGTYTLSADKDAYPPPQSGLEPIPFPTAPDLGGEYTLAATDQRHRAVFNGIWQLRYGFQLSGLYFFGSGQRYPTRWGADLRQIGGNQYQGSGEDRLRPDGTLVPRNNLVGRPVHRVDLRVQRRFPLGGRAGIDGLLEVFNVFNHANYGSYVTEEISSSYGQPQQNRSVAYAPRTLQLGFRFAF